MREKLLPEGWYKARIVHEETYKHGEIDRKLYEFEIIDTTVTGLEGVDLTARADMRTSYTDDERDPDRTLMSQLGVAVFGDPNVLNRVVYLNEELIIHVRPAFATSEYAFNEAIDFRAIPYQGSRGGDNEK